jgi:hypothetical protein
MAAAVCHAVGAWWNSMSKAAARTSSMAALVGAVGAALVGAALVGAALVTAKAHNARAPAVLWTSAAERRGRGQQRREQQREWGQQHGGH